MRRTCVSLTCDANMEFPDAAVASAASRLQRRPVAHSAFAKVGSRQSGYVHHNFCLLTGPARECAYQTMEQCLAAKRGNADFCEPNDAPLNHAPRRGSAVIRQ